MPTTSTTPVGTNGALAEDQQAGQPGNPDGAASTLASTEPTVEERIAAAVQEATDKARIESSGAYRGIQRTLAQVQAENARLKEQAKALGYIPGIAAGLQTLLTETLGEEKAKVLAVQMENAQLKAATTAAQQAQQTAPQYQDDPVDLRQAREQALRYWFPDTAIGADDQRLDWAQDATSTEDAQARFRRSVVKAERQDAAKAAREEADKQIVAERAKAQETLREAGVERSDGSLPSGEASAFQKTALTSKEPKDWLGNNRRLLEMGFQQQDAQAIREKRKNAQRTA